MAFGYSSVYVCQESGLLQRLRNLALPCEQDLCMFQIWTTNACHFTVLAFQRHCVAKFREISSYETSIKRCYATFFQNEH